MKLMRGRALAAIVLAACGAALPATALARVPQDLSSDLRASGTLTIAWHGDPARGCASVGMCGYSGTITVPLRGADGSIDFVGGPGRLEADFGDLTLTDPAIARVRRERPGAPPGQCVDQAPIEDLTLGITSSPGHPYRIGLADPQNPIPLSSRCAGPTNVRGAMPSATFNPARLRRGRESVDLSGRTPFVSGPFSGEVISTARLRLGRLQAQGSGPGDSSQPKTRRRTIFFAELTFRIDRLSGGIAANFHGVGSPGCRALDACGAAGSASYAVQRESIGTLDFTIYGSGRPRGLGWVLRKLERGKAILDAYGDPGRATGQVSETITPGGGTTCTATPPAASLAPLDASREGRRVSLRLDAAGAEVGDIFRTRCPGPSQFDVLGDLQPAEALFPIHSLGARTLQLVLTPPRGGFAAPGYEGSLSGQFRVDLTRLHVRIETARSG